MASPAPQQARRPAGRRRRGANVPGYDGDAYRGEGRVTRQVTLTPELAQHLLDRPWEAVTSTGRPLRQRVSDPNHVRDLAEIILKGQFRLTYQGLGIGQNGSLYNGRHRCLAVVHANQPVTVNITYNLHPDDIPALDSGKQRRAATTLGMSGYDNPLYLGSAARLVHHVLTSELPDGDVLINWSGWRSTRVSDSQVTEIVTTRPQLDACLQWAIAHRQIGKNGLNPAAVAALRFLIEEQADKQTASRLGKFLDAVVDNIGIDDHEHVALVVRRWLDRNHTRHRQHAREAHFVVLLLAWHSYVTNAPVSRFPDTPRLTRTELLHVTCNK